MIVATLGCVHCNATSYTALKKMAAQSITSLRQAFSSGNWHPELHSDCWQHASQSPSARSITLAIEVQHCIAGLDQHHIETVDTWMHNARVRSSVIALRLLSAELQRGDIDSATNRLAKLVNGQLSWRQGQALKRFPIALDWIYSQHSECLSTNHRRRFAARAMFARSLLASVESTAAQISRLTNHANSIRIAVVGNAPDLLNKKQGKAIDNADLIVRFNQANTSDSLAIDVGRRIDLWVVSPGFIGRRTPPSSHNQMLTSIEPLSRASLYWMHLAKQPAQSLSLINPGIWYQLVSELQAPPSAGLLALHTLKAFAPQASVECYGFSALATTEISDNHYGDRGKASSRHNWPLEAEQIRALAGQPKH